jgi:hypothetical protein
MGFSHPPSMLIALLMYILPDRTLKLPNFFSIFEEKI